MKKKLTVIIPVYNEDQENVDFIVNVLDRNNINYIIVDDGSDYPVYDGGGWYSLKSKGDKYCQKSNGLIIRRQKNRGYGNAIKTGIKKAGGNYIAIIDADSQYDPVELIQMWNEMEDEDMVIGRRITHQGGFKRMVGRTAISLVASLCSLKWIPDTNSGSRIFKKNLAKSYLSILCDEFSFTTSLTMCMVLDYHKVRWLPIDFYPRKGASSTVKMLRHGLITLYQIIVITIALRTRNLRKWLRNK